MKIKEFIKEEFIVKGKTQKQIAEEQDVPENVIEYLIKRLSLNHLKSKIKYSINEDKIDITNPVFMYFVGLIATDGYIDSNNNRVALRLKKSESLDILNNLSKYFEYSGPLFTYGKNLELRITSKRLIEVLKSQGIPEKDKTFKLEVPKNFYNDDCLKMYIRGIHDGDGNIQRKLNKDNSYYGGSWRLLTGSKLFIQEICDLLNNKFNLSLKLKINSRKNNKEYPEIYTKRQEGIIIANWFYSDFEDFKIKNKFLKYKSVIQGKDIV